MLFKLKLIFNLNKKLYGKWAIMRKNKKLYTYTHGKKKHIHIDKSKRVKREGLFIMIILFLFKLLIT